MARALGLPQSFYSSLVAVFGTFSQHIPLTMLCTSFKRYAMRNVNLNHLPITSPWMT